ncbi:MAG: SPOR domain-containing protein [Gemmatimonadales bacterium]
MFRWTVLSGALLLSAGTLAPAQIPARPTDPVFVRAQNLVSDGNGIAGRALIDSVIAATPPMARLYPEALFWRATLASNAADAESDYKHIVVDYALAPQAADALLRLAQLELARGDREGALIHLQRIPRDYPGSKLLARSSYWTARVLFEKNDVPNACKANVSALSQADTTEIELRNQIQYQGQRCPKPAVALSPSVVPASFPPGTEKSVDDTSAAKTAASSMAQKPVAPVERPAPPSEATDSRPSIVDPAKAGNPAVEKPITKVAPPTPKVVTPAPIAAVPPLGSGYSVQVAAYTHRLEADKLVSTLRTSGYEARIDGTVAPFRVRIGRYATEKDAEAALKRIKAKKMEGFVVRAPAR